VSARSPATRQSAPCLQLLALAPLRQRQEQRASCLGSQCISSCLPATNSQHVTQQSRKRIRNELMHHAALVETAALSSCEQYVRACACVPAFPAAVRRSTTCSCCPIRAPPSLPPL
jgi:hypothetical protein